MKFTHSVTLSVAVFTLISCSWSRDRVKKNSVLKKDPMYQYTGVYDKDTIRKMILTHLPFGSSYEDAESFCRNNFKGSKMKKHELSRSNLKNIAESKYISHRISRSGVFPVGCNWVDIVFFFDSDDKFTRLIIYKYGVWM